MPSARRLAAGALVMCCCCSSGCTLVKPMVGVITGPILILAQPSTDLCSCNGEGIACVFVVMSAVGVAAGLVTGIISDVQVLTGAAVLPANNWWDPFATNTSPCR